jgi:hypothetical protein
MCYIDRQKNKYSAAFKFYLQSWEERKVGLVGGSSHVVFGKKIPW